MNRVPVILTAFGTRENTRRVRDFLEAHFRKNFPDCDFHWAFAARSVQKNKNPDTPPSPEEILQRLADQGQQKAVLQSLHVVCAAEFHKLIPLCRKAPLDTRLSLPLLASMEDCRAAALAMDGPAGLDHDTAAVLALHGSSHPGGALFHLMGKTFREVWGNQAFYGMIEGEPGAMGTAAAIKKAGFSKAVVFPFTLVTGRHFSEDLAGKTNSWRSTFREAGIPAEFHPEGIGMNPAIGDIFCAHLRNAL
ncbi:sirohydrochlorin cobaltochelatase [Desulfobotulus alkaliphilus]|uniref:Sirohydrochlorin cobaltochelatase n=1 Tax=Desulfobotulus alkaliphilus TaxID=622671 RepID=A0A562S479_9BACT|nr:sirohydrochlorin cobaltochelatase [Desulfobotulus alkaliphilus]TWI75396.1 sirohydrochlorin cobaltochelatase [Desulfobotulus alkaliphilus]